MSTGASLTSKEPRVGTYSDAAIREMGLAGKLIVENFDERNIKQACYELRASKLYYEPPQPQTQEASDFILLRPNQLIVVITLESIELPANVLARILTKGQLFSIGIQPVNTYADPGFSGRLGIVLHNASTNYIRINPGDAIAKLEFSRLERAVEKPYQGQHGYQTKIWPIPVDNVLSAAELQACIKNGRVGNSVDEIERTHGPLVGRVIRRVYGFERRLLISAAVYFICTIALLAAAGTDTFKSVTVNLLVGVGANLVFSVLIYLGTNLRRL
jgi:dCTP deaminase